MNKVYNTQNDFARCIQKFLKIAMPNIRKTQLKIIPFIMLGAILAESFVPLDIAKKLKGDFSLVQVDYLLKELKDSLLINYLILMFSMIILLDLLLILIRKSILIKTFILFLIIRFLMITLLYL